jgi:hypothetical protein
VNSSTPGVGTERIWRLRRRQHSIDALVCRHDDRSVTLEFRVNGRRVAGRQWPTMGQAVDAATEKRHELERAGWATHW